MPSANFYYMSLPAMDALTTPPELLWPRFSSVMVLYLQIPMTDDNGRGIANAACMKMGIKRVKVVERWIMNELRTWWTSCQ